MPVPVAALGGVGSDGDEVAGAGDGDVAGGDAEGVAG